MDEIKFQNRAIELAKKSIGLVSPRPAVGAIVVSKGKIVGEGHTMPSPKEHAETIATKKAKNNTKNSVLYCTLEPHNFFSKGIPCTKLIIESGIKEVSCPTIDKNPKVNGKGFEELIKAGIKINHKWDKNSISECKKLYESYEHKIIHEKPYISLKTAMTIDGKIATTNNESKWITNEDSRKRVHQIRKYSDAIITGINTVLSDDPMLTARESNKYLNRPRYRVVLDHKGQLNKNYRIFNQKEFGDVLWFTDNNVKVNNLPTHIKHYKCKNSIDLNYVVETLYKLGCNSILVESGSTLAGAFFDNNLINKLYTFIAPKIFGGQNAPNPIGGLGITNINNHIKLKNITIEEISGDFLFTGEIDI